MNDQTNRKGVTANAENTIRADSSAKPSNNLSLYLSLVPLAAVTLMIASGWSWSGAPAQMGTLLLTLAVFSFLHSTHLFGWRDAVSLLTITVVVSYSFEQIGVGTGFIYGFYHYSDLLGPKLGHVPFLIPFGWYSMLYPSLVMAMLIVEGAAGKRETSWKNIIWLALVGAMIMTAWDVLTDPLDSNPAHPKWIWERGGEYYGVPLRNFAGWIATAFTAILVYRFYTRRFPIRARRSLTKTVVGLPLVAYGLMMIQMRQRTDAPSEWLILAPFVMGLPLVAAVSQFVKTRSSHAFAGSSESVNNYQE